jgi:hypothetical protein
VERARAIEQIVAAREPRTYVIRRKERLKRLGDLEECGKSLVVAGSAFKLALVTPTMHRARGSVRGLCDLAVGEPVPLA